MAKLSPRYKSYMARQEHICARCANAYDWHNKAVDGHMTLGRCPHWKKAEVCVIASQKACERFRLRKDMA